MTKPMMKFSIVVLLLAGLAGNAHLSRALTKLVSVDRSVYYLYSTHVIPFRLSFKPGVALYEQVVYAARKAVISGQMRPGDAFPSVRALSTALKINPNTAHKAITHLVGEGLLEVRPGTGTVVAQPTRSTAAERTRLLDHELERLGVEARKLGLKVDDVISALTAHWSRLDPGGAPGPNETTKGARKK